jgi:redox-sensing transcriptional repressor
MKNHIDIIHRLSKYRDVMIKLKGLGLVKIFSDNLADSLGISPSLVRKDFSLFQLSGHKRGGYNIVDLLNKLNVILGKDQMQELIIIGYGKMGQALVNYNAFRRAGLQVIAAFDSNSALVQEEATIPIYHILKLEDFLATHPVKVAVLTVPETAASALAESLRNTSIRGIVNFAPVALKSRPECIIHNINIEQEIENVFYRIHFADSEILEVDD